MPNTAQDLFDQGNLSGALAAQLEVVKRYPTQAALRLFLFELLCFAGDWTRAEKHLDIIASQQSQSQVGAQLYRECLAAMRARDRVFAGHEHPYFMAEPPAYLMWHLEGLALLRQGREEEGRAQLDRAEEARPALPGYCNGSAFGDFTDSNEEVAPVLELITQKGYTWLPLEHIQSFEVSPPQKLRDLLWAPARITTTDNAGGLSGMFFIPALYHGSPRETDDLLKLGRKTEWRVTPGGQAIFASGMRMFRVDDDEIELFALREVEFGQLAGSSVA